MRSKYCITITRSDDGISHSANIKDIAEASPFRRAVPQVLACCAKNLLLVDLGMALGFSTIIIPALTGMQHDRNPDESLHFSPTQSSWFGSLLFLTQPVGSLFSGWFTEQIGRKRAMIACTAPHIIAWIMLFYANSVYHVFIAGILLGFGVGLMETSVVTYVSEISHPSIRGLLLIFSYICGMLGVLVIYVLGALMTWRSAAIFGLIVPVVTAVILLFVPETPYWLLSQGRRSDALASLQWLRGWVSASAVQEEFNDIAQYIEKANACDECRLAQPPRKCDHISGYTEKAKDLVRPKFLRPFVMLSLCFVVIQFCGNCAIRPFLVQLMTTMRLPIDGNWTSVIMSATDISANLMCLGLMMITHVGKRPMFLTALAGTMVCALGLSLNAFMVLPPNVSSFDQSATHLEPNNNYSAMVLFLGLAFCGNMAMTVPWMMISEIFPFRVRGTACGIGAAVSYFTMFVSIKTYINLENNLGIAGTFLLYGVLTGIGWILQFYLLPETEGRSLEEIEVFYSNKDRRMFDRKIQPIGKRNDATVRTNMSTSGYDNEAFQ